MKSRSPIELDDASRKQAIASLQRYVREELDQEIGELKATLLLDYVLAEIGPAVYNKALADATSYLADRVADLGAVAHQEEFPYWPAASRRR